MKKTFRMNQVDQVWLKKLNLVDYHWGIIVDEDMDEEEETDNDHPGSDPDFGGSRRTTGTT